MVRYEEQPENIKSDLKHLKAINHIKPPITVGDLLNNVLESLERESKAKNEHKETAPFIG